MMLSKIIKRAFSTPGSLLTWGQTTYGWGRAVNEDYFVPGFVNNFNDIVSVATGQYHLGFITRDNNVYTVGLEDDERLGHSVTNDSQLPRKVTFDHKADIKELSLGSRHSLALTTGGHIYTWGYSGALGLPGVDKSTGTPSLIAPEVFNNNQIVSIGAGRDFSAALDSEGKFYVWGNGLQNFPQWNQSFDRPAESQEVNELLSKRHARIKKFFAIDSFIILLLDNGRLYCRGINNGGIFGARMNPLVMSDLELSSFARTHDELYKNQKIIDAEASSNSIIFRTQSNRIFYSGMNVKFQPTLFPIELNARKIFATESSVGVVTTDNKLYYLNEQLVDDSEFVCKKNRLFISEDQSLSSEILDIGGKYHLRYALVK